VTKSNLEDELFGDLDLSDHNDNASSLVSEGSIPSRDSLASTYPQKRQSRTNARSSALIEPPASKGGGKLIPILLVLILLAGGGVSALYFLKMGPFAEPKPVVKNSSRLVHLVTDPPGASAFFNEKKYGKVTPLRKVIQSHQETRIRVEKKGFHNYYKIVPNDGALSPLKLNIKLKPDQSQKVESKPDAGPPKEFDKNINPSHAVKAKKGTLSFACTPAGTSMEINAIGKLLMDPVSKKCNEKVSLGVGKYSVKFTHPGYQSYTEKFEVKDKQTVTRQFRLKKSRRPVRRRGRRVPKGPGFIHIVSQPATFVYWKGKRIGKTPIKHPVPSGRHAFTLRNPTQGVYRKLYTFIRAGSTRVLKVKFKKGTLKFFIKPWAKVYVDGKYINSTPMPPHKVYEGSHIVELRMGKKRKKLNVYVLPFQTKSVRYSFK